MIFRLLRSLCFVHEDFIPTRAGGFAVLFLLVSATFATSTEKNTNPNPCNLSEDEAQGLSRDASTEANALDAYIATISWMVHQERLNELDCISAQARANRERFPGGQWKIHE